MRPIAEALRDAAIPFRAVDLENLGDRPEVLDALALARALFNPEDRVAWLGVLRAPWCRPHWPTSRTRRRGRSGGSPPAVPELLASALDLLSKDGPHLRRECSKPSTPAALRAAEPAASLGAWLEQVWRRLGGADCVDATGRANLDRLWNCLDQLQRRTGPARPRSRRRA